MEFWQLILLAIVQGITEFLPVSSSGHIVALATVLDVNALALDELNIALHLGTLLAICFVYREQIKALCGVDRRPGARPISSPRLAAGTSPRRGTSRT